MPGDAVTIYCAKIVRFPSYLLRAVRPVLHQQKCLYGYRNDQWGDSCFQGEMQKSSPWIETGDKRYHVSIGHFMYVTVLAK